MSDTNKRATGIAAGVVAALVAIPSCDGGTPDSQTGNRSAAPRQAAWDIHAYPAGLVGRLHKSEKGLLKKQRARLSTVLKRVYDALFLHPHGARRVVHRWFTKKSARALLRSRAGSPTRASRLRTTARIASIGIDAESARRAAVSVRLRASLFKRGRRLALRHRATLWLERSEGRWNVFAFDMDQEQLR